MYTRLEQFIYACKWKKRAHKSERRKKNSYHSMHSVVHTTLHNSLRFDFFNFAVMSFSFVFFFKFAFCLNSIFFHAFCNTFHNLFFFLFELKRWHSLHFLFSITTFEYSCGCIRTMYCTTYTIQRNQLIYESFEINLWILDMRRILMALHGRMEFKNNQIRFNKN